jgi:hypothetical protein
MGRLRGLGVVAVLVASVGIPPGAVYASTTSTDTITGVEVAASSTQGAFVGIASGELSGSWQAVVDHDTLPQTVGSSAAINGGTFALTTRINDQPATVDGALAYNATGITMLNAGTGCKTQKFHIADDLTGVGVGAVGTGTGNVSAVLTHYRARLFGQCVTFAASIAGSITLSFG